MFTFTMNAMYSVDGFWMTPIGITCLLVFLGVSVLNVYSPYCKDTIIDRVLYLATAFICLMALVQISRTGYPVNTTESLVVIFAIRQANNTVKRVLRHHLPDMARRFHF
ncbi:MAG: hypothetical protein [Bacteriophage sp.]|nr:MAG: hypothetical protein [Bacteriophage sp.]